MVGQAKPVPFEALPGIQRDGTELETKAWNDGEWVRFYRGRPQKMPGYRACTTVLNPIPRELNLFWGSDGVATGGYLHSFNGTTIDRVTIDANGATSSITNRTPVGFATNDLNTWTSGTLFNTGSAATSIVAHACANLEDIGAGLPTPIYYGDVTGTSPFATTGTSTDGGVVILQPFVFYFGNNGIIGWSPANDPAGSYSTARVAGSKVVAGLPIQAGSGPAGIFWSLDSLILCTFNVAGSPDFVFRTIDDQISILSSRSVIEFNGRYYWIGVNDFYVYDGRVANVPNDVNKQFFFDNVNRARAQAIWAEVNPQFGEIVWHYPTGDSEECNHAIVFNVYETQKTGAPVWYDYTVSRSAGFSPRVFRYPLKTDSQNPSTLWQHEYGTDVYNSAGVSTAPINSFIESNLVNFPEQGIDRWTSAWRFEPDLIQTGDMTLNIYSKYYPRSNSELLLTRTMTSSSVKEDFITQGRLWKFRLTSNTAGGNWTLGTPIIHFSPRDGRQAPGGGG